MDIRNLTSAIQNIASQIKDNEKLPLPILAAKARKEAEARPNDIQLINASQVLTKMATNKTFISKAEFKSFINDFGATHSKLANVFAEELSNPFEQQLITNKTYARDPNEGKTIDDDYAKLADPLLSNALNGAFNNEETIYTADDAKRAHRAVYAQLLNIGIEPKEIKTYAGRGLNIICSASQETPKGIVNVLIPVEIKEGKALFPKLFLSSQGFDDLTKDKYVSYVKSNMGKSGLKINASKILDILDQVKKQGEDSTVEMAMIRMASAKSNTFGGIQDPNAILNQKMEDNIQTDIELPKFAATEESTYAETLAKPEGVAQFVHGERIVSSGRAMLDRKFTEFGYRNTQIKVADVKENKIFYAVSIGTSTGFNVPVDIEGGKVMPPKVLIANETIAAFTKQAIDGVVKEGFGGNKKALAIASSCSDMQPSKLVEVVKESVAEGNFIRAEEAINVLGEVDPHAQKVAIANMMLSISSADDETQAKMSKIASEPINDVPNYMSYQIFFPADVK